MKDSNGLSRRTVLGAAAASAVALPLAGCTGGNGESAQPADGGSSGGGDSSDGGNDSSGSSGDGNEVVVGPGGDLSFDPESLTVDAGTTVTFRWDSDTHNVVPTGQPGDANWEGHSSIEDEGFEYEYTFEVAGTYEYVCEPHESAGMTGEIVVE